MLLVDWIWVLDVQVRGLIICENHFVTRVEAWLVELDGWGALPRPWIVHAFVEVKLRYLNWGSRRPLGKIGRVLPQCDGGGPSWIKSSRAMVGRARSSLSKGSTSSLLFSIKFALPYWVGDICWHVLTYLMRWTTRQTMIFSSLTIHKPITEIIH